MDSLTDSCRLETNLCPNCIQGDQDLFAALADHLLKLVKRFKNSKKQVI